MKKVAGGLKFFMDELKEKTDSMWNFVPVLSLAYSRGDKEKVKIYENPYSEYSTIQIKNSGLLIRLDENDYEGEKFILKITKGNKIETIPFVYNEDEESFEAFVKGEIENETKFEIIDVLSESL